MLHLAQTKHFANERCQQRGISQELTQLVTQFGAIMPAHQPGAHYLYFSKQSLSRMRNAGIDKRLIEEAHKKVDFRWVVSNRDAVMITVFCASKKNRRVH